MLELVQVRVGIGIVHQLVQKIKSVPNGHFLFIEFQELGLFLFYEVIGLIGMIQPVEFLYGLPFRVFVVAVFFGGFVPGDGLRIGVTFQKVIFPYIEGRERVGFGGGKVVGIHGIHCLNRCRLI